MRTDTVGSSGGGRRVPHCTAPQGRGRRSDLLGSWAVCSSRSGAQCCCRRVCSDAWVGSRLRRLVPTIYAPSRAPHRRTPRRIKCRKRRTRPPPGWHLLHISGLLVMRSAGEESRHLSRHLCRTVVAPSVRGGVAAPVVHHCWHVHSTLPADATALFMPTHAAPAVSSNDTGLSANAACLTTPAEPQRCLLGRCLHCWPLFQQRRTARQQGPAQRDHRHSRRGQLHGRGQPTRHFRLRPEHLQRARCQRDVPEAHRTRDACQLVRLASRRRHVGARAGLWRPSSSVACGMAASQHSGGRTVLWHSVPAAGIRCALSL